LLLLHIGFAYAIYIYRPISQFILLAVLIYFTFIILQNRNKNNEALMAAAYISGAEVYFRMTDAMIFYETGKYAVVIFLLIGMFFKGTSKKTTPFWSYLLILIPGILVASITLSYEAEFRKQIVFNLSGPICLGISALYCYYKKINKEDFQKVINYLLLPLISQTIFLFLFTPTLKEDIINLSGNYVATGGYGPNQISTVLGLGVFLLVTRFFTVKNKLINFLDVILLILMGYRAVISFSRGGIFTSLICIISFLIFHYYTQRKFKQNYFSFKILLLIGSIMSIWTISSIKTFGLIQNRYENRNLAGELKDDVTTGRIDLLTTELQAFYEHPITGIGVGKGYEYRKENMGIEIASHNEFSRLLSEHGMFGVLALLILIFVPVLFWTKFKNNYYFMGFMAFWFLTINHSAMRIALPAFVYGLALLYIVDEKKHPVHRKRLSH
jgi:O-antigen ligase